MTITFQITGPPGGDNAAFVRIDSGQRLTRLLFDCGAGTTAALGRAETQAIDALLFSHLHMDHVAGFDSFFRATYSRTAKPNLIFGPPRTGAIMQHRMQGFLWNLEQGAPGEWDVFDIFPHEIVGAGFRLGEAFAYAHPLPVAPRRGATVLETPDYTVSAYAMAHMTPSLAYVVRESPHANIDTARLAELALRPGPWLQRLKHPQPEEAPLVEIDGASYELARLRADLVVSSPGDSVAYCTDFLLDDAALATLVPALHGCTALICESQYLAEDADLAARNYHMTAVQAAMLAQQAGVGELVLLHVSDRYQAADRARILEQARAIFPNTRFPAHWRIG